MSCVEVWSRKYRTRKSPAFHAGDCKGMTKQGKDGAYVSKADARGVYKWVKRMMRATQKKSKKAATATYLIHDNGNQPWSVSVTAGNSVSIYKGKQNDDGAYVNYDEHVMTRTVKGVYPGVSQDDPGNTVLLHVGGNKYIYVGPEIYEFTMEDDLVAYYSHIGSNDVPYPIVLGTTNVYFMLDHTFLPRNAMGPDIPWAEAYYYYYGVRGKKPNKAWIKPMKGVKVLRRRFS